MPICGSASSTKNCGPPAYTPWDASNARTRNRRFTCAGSSELIAQGNLEDSRVARRGDFAERRCAAHVRSWSVQVDVVEGIEEVGPDRSLAIFAEGLLHGPVEIDESRPAQQIARRASESACSVEGKSGRIEVLGDRSGPRTVSVDNGIADKVGSVLADSAKRAILSRNNRERSAAAPGKRSSRLPSSGHRAEQPRRAIESREIVDSPNRKVVRSVKIRKSVIEVRVERIRIGNRELIVHRLIVERLRIGVVRDEREA